GEDEHREKRGDGDRGQPTHGLGRVARGDADEEQRDDQRHDRHSDRVDPELADGREAVGNAKRDRRAYAPDRASDDESRDEAGDYAVNAHRPEKLPLLRRLGTSERLLRAGWRGLLRHLFRGNLDRLSTLGRDAN